MNDFIECNEPSFKWYTLPIAMILAPFIAAGFLCGIVAIAFTGGYLSAAPWMAKQYPKDPQEES